MPWADWDNEGLKDDSNEPVTLTCFPPIATTRVAAALWPAAWIRRCEVRKERRSPQQICSRGLAGSRGGTAYAWQCLEEIVGEVGVLRGGLLELRAVLVERWPLKESGRSGVCRMSRLRQ